MNKTNVMIGTALGGQGGIATVITIYQEAGFFEKWNITYIATHDAGSILHKLKVALQGLWLFIYMLIFKRVGWVHIHTASDASFWRKSIFIVLAKIAKKPVILNVHGGGFDIFFNRCHGWQRWLIRWVMCSCSHVVALSERWATYLRTLSNHPNTVVIVNPVEVPMAANISVGRNSADILFLGRISQMKGIFDLLDALVILRSKFPEIRLLCGGDGDYQALLDKAATLGLGDCVKFLGWVTRDVKAQYLAESALFVLPSYAEGLPMSILEAMATGMPVVTTPVGGIPEVITNNVEGYLVPPGDIEALSEALGRLLSDSIMRIEMGKAAYVKVQTRFSIDRVAMQWDRLYGDVNRLV